jgi:endonuclease/exonuclease/phosphatase family metal-dependent hydrolase
MFYNVENLFDTINDPNKNDEEFLPEGIKHWNNYRYYKKLNNLAKVISAAGKWEIPALIGMCEVENAQTLDDLTAHSLLKKMKYRYIITDSPDLRGIDVALLYQRDQFKYLYHNSIRIHFPKNPKKKTRDVLHVTGQVLTGDTLDIFVCHFPSRRGGQSASEPDRMYVAEVVRLHVDSLIALRKTPNLLIMGDFNDEPSSRSIFRILIKKEEPEVLYNLFSGIEKTSPTGSYKFQQHWNFIDQIIVSSNLLQLDKPFHVKPHSATIFHPGFLMIDDKANGGKRPRKTFHGPKYEGGFSDHFPVLVDFELME